METKFTRYQKEVIKKISVLCDLFGINAEIYIDFITVEGNMAAVSISPHRGWIMFRFDEKQESRMSLDCAILHESEHVVTDQLMCLFKDIMQPLSKESFEQGNRILERQYEIVSNYLDKLGSYINWDKLFKSYPVTRKVIVNKQLDYWRRELL